MDRLKRVKRLVYSRWEVSDVKVDLVSRRIMVKVKQPLKEDSNIKIQGDSLESEWMFMKMPFYWKGKVLMKLRDKKKLKKLIGCKVRIPKLEEKYKKEQYKKQLEVFREWNR